MVNYSYKKWGVSLRHIWFADALDITGTGDILYFHQMKNVPKDIGGSAIKKYQHTLVSDLSEDVDRLLGKVNKNYRYEIRRCQRVEEEVSYRIYDEKNRIGGLIEAFEVTYNQMYRDKGMRNTFNKKQIKEMQMAGVVVFTIGFHQDIPLVFHSYVYDEEIGRVRFFYSASPFRQDKAASELIGRINKGLHWFDMCEFKKRDITYYDWGGIANPDNPNGIDRFKMGFGGEKTQVYNMIVGNSLKGKLAVKAYAMKGRVGT